MEWAPQEKDKDAAWDMYIELLTRITTQRLSPDHGDEKTALESVYSLFGITRQVIRAHGRDCMNFTKIAIVILNQIIRPFTAKWHRLSLEGAFDNEDKCKRFQSELIELQNDLLNYGYSDTNCNLK